MRNLFLAALCILFVPALAQRSKRATVYKAPTPLEVLSNDIATECLFTNKYSKLQRLQFYPFNKAAKVVLIAFEEGQNTPVKNKIIDNKKVLEQIILTATQTDSLTSLLYNVGFTPVKTAHPFNVGANCYEPRNAILFLDAKGRAFEYLEICFGCQQTKRSSPLIKEGEYCSTKFDLLRKFFIMSGIKYGTSTHQPILSYKEIFSLDSSEAIFAIQNKLVDKSADWKNINQLNETGKVLLFSLNADEIFNGSSGLSGLAGFYSSRGANYYQQTVAALKQIKAPLTLQTLEESRQQWPLKTIPVDHLKRRTDLLRLVNSADPKWKKLEEKLFDYRDEVGARVYTSKEDLDKLIFEYANSHRHDLLD